MVFFFKLLHVLRCGTASTCLKETAPIHQWYDREHLSARAELENREEISQIVTKHVTSDRNCVFTSLRTFEGDLSRFNRR